MRSFVFCKVLSDFGSGCRVIAWEEMRAIAQAASGLTVSANDNQFQSCCQFFRMGPAGKGLPLVKADEEKELCFGGEGWLEGFHGLPCIGWEGKLELEIAY